MTYISSIVVNGDIRGFFFQMEGYSHLRRRNIRYDYSSYLTEVAELLSYNRIVYLESATGKIPKRDGSRHSE
jgi:hypothetical protein